jgi:hydrophobe/amphiphile efflux-3 (HAE3) family protein
MSQLSHFVVRFRWPIIVGFVLTTAAFASRIPTIEVDPQIKNQLPADMPSRVNLDAIEELFGGTDMVMAVVSADDVLATAALDRVRLLSRKIERIPKIDRVLSLFTLKDISSADGIMTVESAVVHVPDSGEEREELRQRLRDNDLVYGNVVSEDFRHTAIIALLNAKANDEEILAGIHGAVAATPGPGEITIGGLPFVRAHVGMDIRSDIRKFVPFALLIMLAFLLLAFRQVRGVFLPAVVVVMSILFAFGLLVVIGWKVEIVTVLLPLILVAVANDYGIHLYARYQEENTPDNPASPPEIARSIVLHLARPVAITGITTVGGLLCLLSHVVVPAKKLGILAGAGVAYALVGSVLFIPAVLSLLPKAKPVAQASSGSNKLPLLERLLRANARLVTARPRTVVAVLVAGALAVSAFAYRVVVDTNPINYYSDDAPVVRASNLLNDQFGGSTSISVIATGDIKDPALLSEIDALEAAFEELPTVGQTSSVAKTVERMSRAMHDNDPAMEKLPNSRDAVAQYFELYMMSGEPEDFDRLVDFPYENALLTARINSLSVNDIAEVVDFATDWVNARPDAPFSLVGGFAAVFAELVDAVVWGQVVSLLLSLAVVAILVAILFRSIVAGLLGAVPLVLSMGLLFGLMGLLGLELNVPTAMLTAIMVGVGIDYTIHFLWRYREERHRHAPATAVTITLTTTGRGIVFNALSVIIGFAAVLLSSFVPVQTFGFLIVVSIGSCLVGAMALLPAIVQIIRPRFLEPRDPT